MDLRSRCYGARFVPRVSRAGRTAWVGLGRHSLVQGHAQAELIAKLKGTTFASVLAGADTQMQPA